MQHELEKVRIALGVPAHLEDREEDVVQELSKVGDLALRAQIREDAWHLDDEAVGGVQEVVPYGPGGEAPDFRHALAAHTDAHFRLLRRIFRECLEGRALEKFSEVPAVTAAVAGRQEKAAQLGLAERVVQVVRKVRAKFDFLGVTASDRNGGAIFGQLFVFQIIKYYFFHFFTFSKIFFK